MDIEEIRMSMTSTAISTGKTVKTFILWRFIMAKFIEIDECEIINLDSIRRITKSGHDGHANVFFIDGSCTTYDSYDDFIDKIKPHFEKVEV